MRRYIGRGQINCDVYIKEGLKRGSSSILRIISMSPTKTNYSYVKVKRIVRFVSAYI